MLLVSVREHVGGFRLFSGAKHMPTFSEVECVSHVVSLYFKDLPEFWPEPRRG